MLKAYINYPDPHVTVHFNPNCGNIQSQNKVNQRYHKINIETLSTELKKFKTKEHRFGAHPYNDMWVEIDFQDQEFELAVLEYICVLLEKNYGRFKNLKPGIHC